MENLLPYRIYTVFPNKPTYKYWESYYTLEAAIWEMLVKLDKLDALDMVESGEFVETQMFNQKCIKRYVVTVKCPYTKIMLKKMHKGDLNIDNVRHLIKTIKEIYIKDGKNERI